MLPEKHVRSLVWFGVVLAFFPCWLLAQHVLHFTLAFLADSTGWTMTSWLMGLLQLAVLGLTLMTLAYAAANRLDKKWPNSPPRSARWQDA
jgi:hypothetical protein